MRRALGKGLSQLIAEQYDATPSEVPVESISPNPRQPRGRFAEEALEELAASIREHGVIQPLIVRPRAEGTYELIAGERRLRAAKIAGLKSVPIVVRSAGHQDSLELALIENVQREDINAVECAKAYRRLIDEFGLTQEQVAEKVGKSRVAVANTVRLLRLPKEVLEGLDSGVITEGHARAILAFDGEERQIFVYRQILQRGLTVRDVEELAKAKDRQPEPERPRRDPNPHDQQLEEALSSFLGSPARLQRKEGRGKLTIEFYSDDDLERILDVLGLRL